MMRTIGGLRHSLAAGVDRVHGNDGAGPPVPDTWHVVPVQVKCMAEWFVWQATRRSAAFWDLHYRARGTSGPGSRGGAAKFKAAETNRIVAENGVKSVIEFGCGDGNQLSLARYPGYVGLDVSRTAIGLCQRRFAQDQTKSFFLYDGDCFTDRAGIFAADLAIEQASKQVKLTPETDRALIAEFVAGVSGDGKGGKN